MALEDILKKIREDAQEEAGSLISLARAEAEAIGEKAQRKANSRRAVMTEEARERAEVHAKRIETLASLELRKDVLREKKQLIREAFDKAEEAITNLPPSEYIALLKPLILEAVESGNEEILVSERHIHLFTPDFMKSLNDELGDKKGNLRLSEEGGSFSGGFVLREGKRETNLTLQSLFESSLEKLELLAANALFGEDKQDG